MPTIKREGGPTWGCAAGQVESLLGWYKTCEREGAELSKIGKNRKEKNTYVPYPFWQPFCVGELREWGTACADALAVGSPTCRLLIGEFQILDTADLTMEGYKCPLARRQFPMRWCEVYAREKKKRKKKRKQSNNLKHCHLLEVSNSMPRFFSFFSSVGDIFMRLVSSYENTFVNNHAL